MKQISNDNLYKFTGELVWAMFAGSSSEKKRFGITSPIHEEMLEELVRSGEQLDKLGLPRYEQAFIPDTMDRMPIDLFEVDTPRHNWRVSCQLWAKGVKSDLTLTADLVDSANKPSLIFRLSESQ